MSGEAAKGYRWEVEPAADFGVEVEGAAEIIGSSAGMFIVPIQRTIIGEVIEMALKVRNQGTPLSVNGV